MNQKIDTFSKQLQDSQNIVFFGGAGVSTESGIPDFRSADGIYLEASPYPVPVESIISHSFYEKYPAEFFDYYFKHLVFQEARPNSTHNWLAELEKYRKNVTVITQNIDGLHQAAGSQKVLELHGNVHRNYCVKCGKFYSLETLQRDESGIPVCSCGGIVKPDVVLYEEQLDQNVLSQVVEALLQADLLIVGGTSLAVYPAAGLIHYFRGQYLTLINKTPLRVEQADLIFEDTLSHVFQSLPPLEQLFNTPS